MSQAGLCCAQAYRLCVIPDEGDGESSGTTCCGPHSRHGSLQELPGLLLVLRAAEGSRDTAPVFPVAVFQICPDLDDRAALPL